MNQSVSIAINPANMPSFIGTKVLKAFPMTRGTYNQYRGWPAPEGEDQNVSGYLVEYTDGGKPNHPDHKGYISWSPREQFDNAYYQFDMRGGLPPHQQRVVAEKAELDNRRVKLFLFLGTSIYAGLEPAEQDRLQKQHSLMVDLSSVLQERISAFE